MGAILHPALFLGRAYYAQQRAQGKSRVMVIRASAFKWMQILFRCWKKGQPYDEASYERALAARRPRVPLGSAITAWA
jgi:hypothetical protein